MRLTRRDFAGLAGVWAAARVAPAQQDPESEGRRVGYCIVGLGRISMQHFMPATRTSKSSRVTALVSGHRDKAERMAAQYGVPAHSIYSYENYDAIADNKDIEAVYIALPNSMHAEYTIRAAKAGKHVLCEKPMATSVADCEAMIDACHKANRKLMIAYRCQLEPTNLRAIQLIRDGKLGKVQSLEAQYGFNIPRGEWRLNMALAGGGPLMDVGIYALNATRYLTGEEPQEVRAYASVIDHDGRFNEVEENVTWTTRFPSGILATCNTTYGGTMPSYFRVHGSKGVMTMQPAFDYQGQHLIVQAFGEPPVDDTSTAHDPSQFVAEADHFSECVLHNREPKSPGEEGLRDTKWMSAIYGAAGRKTL
jgi:predicted dehydrogenase